MKKMKAPVFFLLMILIFTSVWVSAAEIAPAPGYFPLQVGNEWTYQRTSQIMNEKVLVNVTGRMQPAGSTTVFYQLNNYNGQAHWVGQTPTGIVYEYPANVPTPTGTVSENPYFVWYSLNAEVGKSWTMHINTKIPGVIIGSDGAVLTVISRNEIVRVPAGVFSTVHIRFQTGVMDAGITDEWFAPGVGLVKRAETSFAGGITTELVRAVINGTVIENPLVVTSVETDRPIYWEDHMPSPIVPTTGPQITIACTVKPISGQSTVLNFKDYNVWDVTVMNPDGRIVWSNPKIMAPAPIGGVNRTIPGSGETTKFSFKMAYGSMVGQYKVVAKLLVSKNPPADAVTTFEYAWVY